MEALYNLLNNNNNNNNKIIAAEMRFLRPMAGYILLDKKRSSDIREQLDI